MKSPRRGLVPFPVVLGLVGVILAVSTLIVTLVTVAPDRTVAQTSGTPSTVDRRGFVAIEPVRIIDTRTGIGGVAATKLSNSQIGFAVTGRNGVPAQGVVAVALNVTATDTNAPEEGGYLSVYPCGSQPDVSSLNFTSGFTVPNTVITPLDGTGNLCISSYGTAHVIVDLNGWYLSASTLNTLSPARVMDTRTGRGGVRVGPVSGDGPEFRFTGLNGIPDQGVVSVSFNLTVAEPSIDGVGYVTAYPCGSRPNASNLNFTTGPAVANSVIVPLSSTGTVCFYVYGRAHLIVDVNGWFATDPGFTPVTPSRILDTRLGIGSGTATRVGSTPLQLRVVGAGGVPSTGVAAVSMNVTVTNTSVDGGGYVTVYPCGDLPNVSNINFVSGQTVANTVIVSLSGDGSVCFSVYGTADILADVNGWYAQWSMADEYAAFSTPLPRSTVDRPDDLAEDRPKIKVLYAVPSFQTDRRRDLTGEISKWMFDLNEWFAAQNGGYGLAFDTYNGALDIGYLPVDVSYDTWLDWFTTNNPSQWPLYPLVQHVRNAGWNISVPIKNAGLIDFSRSDLYFLVMEAPAGKYFKTGTSDGCRQVIDPVNYAAPLMGQAILMNDGSACTTQPGPFPFDASVKAQAEWRGFDYGMDVITQYMRWLPGCSSPRTPRDGERYVIPGTNIEETRGGFLRDILPFNDPLAKLAGTDGFPYKATAPPEMDPEHTTYFRISNGPLANQACNSDIAKHPLWSTTHIDADRSLSLPRVTADRPDDVTGKQVHAVYVVARGASDRAFDTDGHIHRALVQFDDWLRSQSGGKGVRLDTYNGIVDVTYLPLGKTAASYTAGRTCTGPPCPYEADLLTALTTAGLTDPNKQYVFYYEGGIQFGGRGLCGGSMFGQASFINLDHAVGSTCSYIPWSSTPIDTWSIGLLSGHELFHALGAVCGSGASSSQGHSSTPGDLMYASADGPGIRLDVGRDDYWGTGNSCDLSNHPIMTTASRRQP